MSFKVNIYNPKGQAYAPRIGHQDWERHRTIIGHLHAAKTPRKLMLKQLRDEYAFKPTLGQLQAKCKEWDLRVYTKESSCVRTPAENPRMPNSSSQQCSESPSTPAFHLVNESSLIDEWSDDYRVHRTTATTNYDLPLRVSDTAQQHFQDRALPPEYIGGGLFANTVDSHWPVPEDIEQCGPMLQAAHYYYAIYAFQQSFSIYRAVYLCQRRYYTLCDPELISTILWCACSAVTDHQRNIMHSVLTEVGSSSEIDTLDPLYIECLQSASLNMLSSEFTCDIESQDLVRARASAYLQVFSMGHATKGHNSGLVDVQAMLYQFEHALLMQEHETRVIQKLLIWCEATVDHMHRELDDIFLGSTSSGEEHDHKIGQVLSGYLLTWWHKQTENPDDEHVSLLQLANTDRYAFRFCPTMTHTLVALAFMVVGAVKHDPILEQVRKTGHESPKPWFTDAAKLFKRGIRMLCRLDERSRCTVFADIFLERFYTSISYRQKAYNWSEQLPAIVDCMGMSFAQQTMPAALCYATGAEAAPLVVQDTELEISVGSAWSIDAMESSSDPVACMIESKDSPAICAPSPMSESNSIASFIDTYQRTLKRQFDSKFQSRPSTPGDFMSFTSSADFKFGVVARTHVSDTDSLWHVVLREASGDMV